MVLFLHQGYPGRSHEQMQAGPCRFEACEQMGIEPTLYVPVLSVSVLRYS